MARRRGPAAAVAAAASSPALVAAVSVMALAYYSTVFVFLDHWLGLGTAAGVAHASAFSLVLAACFFSFLCAAAADPGSVPAAFSPDAEDPQGLKSRYCDKCCLYKPARTHHCKVCKRCALKMDHHCVWINNCVGYANYKSFIICVLNATIGSLYSSVIFVCDLLQTEHDFGLLYVKIIHVLAGVVLFSLCLTIGSLLCWHIYLMCHNMTTIEYREAVRAKWLAKKSGQNYRHRFDQGMRKNIQMVMGTNVFCWLCPTATGHLKDGTEFQNTNN